MTHKDDSAFGFVENKVHYGLSKREYFAGMAMQALLKDTDAERINSEANDFKIIQISAASVKAADFLIKLLNK